MNEHVTISKKVSTGDDLDYFYLRRLGIEHIEKFAGKIWTDYNEHDPGITTIEALCYAITDLSYRIEMPIENLLAAKKDNLKSMHKQFLSAINILPSKPVTALDYRRFFIHHKGVKNAWILPHQRTIYLNEKENPALSSYTPFVIDEQYKDEYTLKGLNDIYIDFENDVTDKDLVIDDIRKMYHKNRNLCEDLVNIYQIPEQEVGVCAYIDIEPDADEELIQALIILALEEYFSPSVKFYSLEQMLDKGYTTDQIFEGPIPFENTCVYEENLQSGFIDNTELEKANLRREIRLSDIINIIMGIDGVKTINEISIGNCGEAETFGDSWILCINEYHKPVLCEKSSFNFTKDILPIGVNKDKVDAFIAEFKEKEKLIKEAIITEDIEMPTGIYADSKDYSSVQHDYPEAYGLSDYGLPNNATTDHKAKVKQLKAYLLFFDQVLASYFAQLSKAKDLLSVDESLKNIYTVNAISELASEDKQTYFSEFVDDIKDINELITPDVEPIEKRLIDIFNTIHPDMDEDKLFYERRNSFLDHLISRFAEKFSDYVFVMKSIYSEDKADLNILKAKTSFLEDYKEISCGRGSSFNYCDKPNIWDTLNVSGVQKRIARLCGVQDYSRRNLINDAMEIFDELDIENNVQYGWIIRNGATILMTSKKRYKSISTCYDGLRLAYEIAIDTDNYEIVTEINNVFYNLVDKTKDPLSEHYILATDIAPGTTNVEAENNLNDIITFLESLPEQEGMYIVEHILLRPDTLNMANADVAEPTEEQLIPDAAPEDFMPVCIDPDCNDCGPDDPYSFRVSVVLPGWTKRFSNIDFRRYMEKIIREELPAHILARICWVGHVKGVVPDKDNDMLCMQTTYKDLLEKLPCNYEGMSQLEIQEYRDSLRAFIDCLNNLNTIYQEGRLHDCNNDETETEGNKIILGRTNIGNL